jgi:hypothetical protein
MSFQRRQSDFDKQFDSTFRFFKAWFVFVALLTLSLICGGGFILIRVLQHFSIL